MYVTFHVHLRYPLRKSTSLRILYCLFSIFIKDDRTWLHHVILANQTDDDFAICYLTGNWLLQIYNKNVSTKPPSLVETSMQLLCLSLQISKKHSTVLTFAIYLIQYKLLNVTISCFQNYVAASNSILSNYLNPKH